MIRPLGLPVNLALRSKADNVIRHFHNVTNVSTLGVVLVLHDVGSPRHERYAQRAGRQPWGDFTDCWAWLRHRPIATV